MAEQERNLIDGYAGEQHLHGERVPEHVGMASLFLAVGCSDIRRLEQTAITPLPICDSAFWLSIAAPEEIAWVRPGTIGDIHQCIDNMGGKRHIDRLPGLGLIEQEAVAMQTVPFKPEYLRTAELGEKSEFWDHRLRFNADFYYSKYLDQQTFSQQLDADGVNWFREVNAGTARIWGLEAEVQAEPDDTAMSLMPISKLSPSTYTKLMLRLPGKRCSHEPFTWT